jgi:site-specific recombinase XerD
VWAQADLDRWYLAGRQGQPPTPHSLQHQELGRSLTSYDLRRTLAQMLYQSGAMLEQIQETLGHMSIASTVAYLGIAR